MCSLFGGNEKLEKKLEDFVKKMEDRMADIEDKQDGDDENNKEKFTELEDQLEKLQVRMTDQQDRYEENMRELRHQLELANVTQTVFFVRFLCCLFLTLDHSPYIE